MYKIAPSQHHLQLAAPPPYPGLEGSRNAAPLQSLFGDSNNGSDWSDSESEESTYRDDRESVITRRHRTLPRRHKRLPRSDPAPNETYADQGDWDENRYAPRSGGQAVPYMPYGIPTRPFPPTEDPYSQPQAPLGTHPQSQHQPPRSGPLPSGQNDMARENPFAPLPRSVPWNGDQPGPYGNSAPAPVYEPHPPWHPAAAYGYAPPNPAHFSAVPPGPYPYPDPMTQYYGGGYAPAQNPPDLPLPSEPAPPPRRRRRRPPPAGAPPQEHDLEGLQRRLRAVEIDGQHAEDLRQAQRVRAQAERQQWEMERLRQDIERSFKTDIRDAVDDIRREIQMSQSESHSDPGRAPSRMGGGGGGRRAGYAAWAERDGGGGGGEQDALMQEVRQFMEGKRRLHPQDQAAGAAFSNRAQAGPGSARESRIDPELRSELESIVYDILGGSDVAPRQHRRASSRSVHGRAASDGFHPRFATQADHRDWRRETYDGGVHAAASANPIGLGRSPVRVAFEQNGYAGPSAAASRPTDERDWLGVPRKSRRRPQQEDAGVPGALRMQEAGLHRQPQPQPPPQANNARYHTGANAPHSGSRGVAGGGGGEEAVYSARAMAYQDSINNNGARLGGLGPGRAGGPASRRGEYMRAAAHEDEDAAAFLTDDESEDPEVFPKRDASYPEFPAGHPDLRHRVQLPRAPKPPNLRQAGM